MKILQAIVRTYLETGEPVGSRTISKYTDLHLSPATIRNEMSDLEELGLIVQPHTSAGRIPSDAGYRLYVDEMLREKQLEQSERESLLLEREDRLENLLKQVVKLLAANTNYASMISTPVIRSNKIKFIQLSQVDSGHILAVIVIEGNLIRNTMIPVSEELNQQELLKLNMLLNGNLAGTAVEEINLGLIESIKQQAGEHRAIISTVIDAAAEAIRADERPQIYTSGADNIFRYPELADQSKASRIIGDFEEKRVLGSIVQETLAEQSEDGIQVYIGSEVPALTNGMENCSIVTATYELGEGMKGTIGIIGPKRMDYDRVVGVMKQIMSQLDDYYKKE
ncbi:heat-inducible transcriptional repressor HrcA [Lachnoclostridium sp. Marseille-P6806]|uniref:heat-inducible transcriptional repressor HrcA n=1 Tax=Lachnoclostridium sp. Marseille-P6806 TaxID=2364793 RepID=UPI001F5EEA1D|nr:heat-inducible transcriptional repressor HrcA [Lachnoclostridium sp. Marseille-P6806]